MPLVFFFHSPTVFTNIFMCLQTHSFHCWLHLFFLPVLNNTFSAPFFRLCRTMRSWKMEKWTWNRFVHVFFFRAFRNTFICWRVFRTASRLSIRCKILLCVVSSKTPNKNTKRNGNYEQNWKKNVNNVTCFFLLQRLYVHLIDNIT